LFFPFKQAGNYKCICIAVISTKTGYRGEIIDIIKNKYNIILEGTQRNKVKEAFTVQAKRWIVEKTISWFDGTRRLCRNFERLLENSRAMLLVFAIRLSLNRVSSETKNPSNILS
jgi:hypothetical protein